ncbi:dynein light chain Tctex-type 5-like [Stegostoma tigrinum]|uniref:dynein light chain Tctex-type 5-like n=1 Tax=Stegostoma tigrinum TaxID=3053191 RepID=UPI00202B480C|nr:dynein light chain Tctex-type 5-like [Stegostoma tigrinum]XP_059496005.1 dynein light chain Tctex-type 5-like [Stegostoma tigrinum]
MDKRRSQSSVPARGKEKQKSISSTARTNRLTSTCKATSAELGAVKGRVPQRNVLSVACPPAFTFSGIVVARRLTKNLKERTALKRAAKVSTVTKIVNDQVPPFSSNPPEKFCTSRVQVFLEEYLPDKLRDIAYGPALASQLSKEMSNEIKEFAKGILPPRYKLVCMVTLGEKKNEDAVLTSQALWDSYADTFVSRCSENGTMFCVACVFAVYCE